MKNKPKRIKKTIKISYVIDSSIGITSVRAVTDDAPQIVNVVFDDIIKHPRKVYHTKSFRRTQRLVNICRRAVYAITHVKFACSRQFPREDVPRHQYDERAELPARAG